MTRAVVPESKLDDRVLVFAPIGRDAELTRRLLDRAAIPSVAHPSIAALLETLERDGAAALLLTEEALDDAEIDDLMTALGEQPPWSYLPVLLFAGGSGAQMAMRTIRALETLRNVTLLERPIRLAAVLSAVRAAVRSRERQYEVRDLLVALHRARSEAESANRLKDEFLATLSHELRTPLNAILGWTSMLVRGQVEPARQPRVFQALDRNAHAQAQLIADVLDVSRIITGKLQLQMTAVDLCDVVALAVDAVRPAADAKQIRLVVDQRERCAVRGDAARLQQVFWNLLSNAVKFTPFNGTVSVDIARDGHQFAVAVTDNGAGIAKTFVPFVFDRFRQADQTTTRTHGGLGLGLSIVKHLVELQGGSVTASSDGPGRGSRFEVRLPAAESASFPQPADAVGDAPRLDGHMILVVDDDESTREMMAAALEAAHAEVRIAASAKEARAHLGEGLPALIIADLGMPDEDSFSLIRGVRDSAARNIPAIALSAYADPASRDAALAAGFTEFVAKPALPHKVIELANTLLAEVSARIDSRRR